MELIEQIEFWVTFASRFFTIGATGIAIWVFIKNKDKISSAIDVLLNYSKRITLNELKYKIERLNDYTTNDTGQKKEIINILSDIEGQILGNKKVHDELENQVKKIQEFIDNSKLLTEPKKRSLVSELRESVRNIDISNFQEIVKNK